MSATPFCFQMDTAVSQFRSTRTRSNRHHTEARAKAEPSAPLDLLARARRGNRDALAGLVVPYASGLYLSALGMTGNPSDAEDVR